MMSRAPQDHVRLRWTACALIGMGIASPVILFIVNLVVLGDDAAESIWIVLPGFVMISIGTWLTARADAIAARQFSETLCDSCGYDLRGAIHDVCPECGEAVVRSASG